MSRDVHRLIFLCHLSSHVEGRSNMDARTNNRSDRPVGAATKGISSGAFYSFASFACPLKQFAMMIWGRGPHYDAFHSVIQLISPICIFATCN